MIKNNKQSQKTVFVGLSGGVDSSVSAALLKKATPNNYKKLFGRPTPKGFRGYNVVGVFIKTWQPDFIECTWPEERRDAMRVAAHLDIPFLTFDLSDVYKKEVGDYMIREYKAGRTPNPDVMCNKEVKFGAFLKKALAMGANYVATGHYAQISEKGLNSGKPPGLKMPQPRGLRRISALGRNLLCGTDPAKDQSYFLWTLTQDQLKHILFPVGHLNKSEVRKLAGKFGLPTEHKKDSQGICFLGKVEMKDFLKHYIKEKRGDVLLASSEKKTNFGKRPDLKEVPRSGLGEKFDFNEPEVIGYHDGAAFYTLGERHGFTITKKSPNDKPYYVVRKDIKKNILYVSQDPTGKRSVKISRKEVGPLAGSRSDLEETDFVEGKRLGHIKIKNINWISGFPPATSLPRLSGASQLLTTYPYKCQIRYHGELLPCRIEIGKENTAKVILKNIEPTASAGQSVVVYLPRAQSRGDKDICLGGGVIE